MERRTEELLNLDINNLTTEELENTISSTYELMLFDQITSVEDDEIRERIFESLIRKYLELDEIRAQQQEIANIFQLEQQTFWSQENLSNYSSLLFSLGFNLDKSKERFDYLENNIPLKLNPNFGEVLDDYIYRVSFLQDEYLTVEYLINWYEQEYGNNNDLSSYFHEKYNELSNPITLERINEYIEEFLLEYTGVPLGLIPRRKILLWIIEELFSGGEYEEYQEALNYLAEVELSLEKVEELENLYLEIDETSKNLQLISGLENETRRYLFPNLNTNYPFNTVQNSLDSIKENITDDIHDILADYKIFHSDVTVEQIESEADFPMFSEIPGFLELMRYFDFIHNYEDVYTDIIRELNNYGNTLIHEGIESTVIDDIFELSNEYSAEMEELDSIAYNYEQLFTGYIYDRYRDRNNNFLMDAPELQDTFNENLDEVLSLIHQYVHLYNSIALANEWENIYNPDLIIKDIEDVPIYTHPHQGQSLRDQIQETIEDPEYQEGFGDSLLRLCPRPGVPCAHADGGPIPTDQLALIHAGEYILPRDEVDRTNLALGENIRTMPPDKVVDAMLSAGDGVVPGFEGGGQEQTIVI